MTAKRTSIKEMPKGYDPYGEYWIEAHSSSPFSHSARAIVKYKGIPLTFSTAKDRDAYYDDKGLAEPMSPNVWYSKNVG